MIIRRLPFYEVSREAYLFRDSIRNDEESDYPEEPVRQWCAFELMRAYGFRIADLVFEHRVRIGSKRFKIDILILRDGAPLAVVECKRREHTKTSDAIEQAVSYAGSERIRATYAVYTNGTDWVVQRHSADSWVAVPDLPNGADPSNGRDQLLSVLQTFDALLPILHGLGQTLEGDHALRFLSALQVFFHGENLITQGTTKCVRMALDNVLRVLSARQNDVLYQVGKLKAARRALEEFRSVTGIGFTFEGDEGSAKPVFQLLRDLHYMTLDMARSAPLLGGADSLALGLLAVLTEAGSERFIAEESAFRLSPAVQQSLREFLSYGLEIYLGMTLPPHFDAGDMAELRHYTRAAWEASLETN